MRETGEDERPGRVGRPSLTLELHDRIVAVGLEVNVDYLAVCVEDLAGTVWHERRVYTENRGSAPGPVLDRLAQASNDALDAVEQQGLRTVGVGVAVPGLVYDESGTIVLAPNLGWSDVAVGDELARRLGDVAEVENEANLPRPSPALEGAARELDNFLSVFGEVGVGAGIIVDGELYRGAHGFGGEFGHLDVDRDGLPCACGGRGCLETIVGQEAIARTAGIVPLTRRTRSLTAEIVRRAEAGDTRVLPALRDAAAASASPSCRPEPPRPRRDRAGWMLRPARAWLSARCPRRSMRRRAPAESRSRRRPSGIGEAAAARGAAALILRRVLEAPWTTPAVQPVAEVAG